MIGLHCHHSKLLLQRIKEKSRAKSVQNEFNDQQDFRLPVHCDNKVSLVLSNP